LIAVCLVALLPAPSKADQFGPAAHPVANVPAPIHISAQRIEYYADLAVMIAQGFVQVTQPDGSIVTGDTFSMSLSLRRFLLAGHVRLQTSAGVMNGAAYADFLVFRREYFVPLDPEADRWTFSDYDFAHPSKGRQMPGDAFFIPDVSGSRPYIVASSVTIDANTYARFTPATFVLLDGAVWTFPMPPFTYNFSVNQNFAVNALPGASVDVPFNFAGSPVSLSAIHYRYDQINHSYAALDQHFAWPQAYIAFSLSPATLPAKQWNLLAYSRTSLQSALQLNTQLFTYQYGLTQPLSASGFADVQYLQGARQSAWRFDVTQQYASLLAQPALGYYGNPSHPWIPNHPFTAGAQWNGYDQKLLRTGLTYRLSSGYAYDWDTYGIAGTNQTDVSSYNFAGSLYTPVYPGPLGTGLNASYSIGQTYLSFPNIIQAQNFTATASRRVSRSTVLIGSIVINSATARNELSIVSPNQATGVPPLPSSSNGLPVVLGPFLRATNRAYGLTTVLSPSPNFQFTLAATQSNYSPEQVPLVAGPPRYALSGDLRARITRVLFLDVQRSYQFNWGGQPWSPQFVFTLTSQ
jgi:hypothetical protein